MSKLFALALILTIFTAGEALGAPSQRRYVFIDGGAHLGESYTAFKKTGLYARYPWEIIAIEANPYLIAKLRSVPNLTVIPKAIWISNGTKKFFIDSETSGKNSLIEERLGGDPHRPITVNTFDFSRWLESSFSKDDYLCVSLDIEGAEYEVVEKMIRDGTILYVDRLYVEFHNEALPDKDGSRGWKLLSKANKLGVITGEDSVEDIIKGKGGKWLDSIGDGQGAGKDSR